VGNLKGMTSSAETPARGRYGKNDKRRNQETKESGITRMCSEPLDFQPRPLRAWQGIHGSFRGIRGA